MARTCFVAVAIRGPKADDPERMIELGEFHATWKPGVLIGSDPGCTIVLPELPPVAVRVRAASNHKVIYRLPEGTTVDEARVDPDRPYDQRVDHSRFDVGPYKIVFGAVYRDV